MLNNTKPPKLNQPSFFNQHAKLVTLLVVAIILVAGYFLLLAPKYEQLSHGGKYNPETKRQQIKTLEKHLTE